MTTPPLVLVADEPRVTRHVAEALSGEGFRVVAAHRGEAALAVDDELRPDIVLLDLALPDLDGFEVMRQLQERRQVPIVLLSAKGSTADKARGLDLGADDYLAKPFQDEELAARVRAILRRTLDVAAARAWSASTTWRSTSPDGWSRAAASSSTCRGPSGCC